MKVKIPLSKALPLAEKIVTILAPACDGIAIAGSIRRGRRLVGDIEIVAIPRYVEGIWQPSLFETEKPAMVSELDIRLSKLVESKPNFSRGDKNGDLFKNFVVQIDEDGTAIGLDLFITTPPQWGYIMALRTGPADFGRAWVTQQRKGGLLPDEYHFAGGWLVSQMGEICTPDEREFFETIGLPWIEPEQRDDWRRVVDG